MKSTALSGPAFGLTLNVGSSSLKFAVFRPGEDGPPVAEGSVARAGGAARWLDRVLAAAKPRGAGGWLGVGHRLVHGGPRLSAPQRIDARMLAELRRLIPFAPEHLPAEISLIEEVGRRLPGTPQIACFDTAFHATLPRVARILPIPRRYEKQGVRRYGFHGLAYEFLLGELRRRGDPAAERGRVILAHLGGGASLAAVRDGACIDTTMAFTPAAGLVMGTRPGDLDPGVLLFLAQDRRLPPAALRRLINHESGLRGVSGTSADMRTLLRREPRDPRAAEAVALFCRQAGKSLGAAAAVLGGLDTLVFSGGIGEHDATIRTRICNGLGFLGIELDEARNRAHAPVISAPAAAVTVRVIPANEEAVIARALWRLLEQA